MAESVIKTLFATFWTCRLVLTTVGLALLAPTLAAGNEKVAVTDVNGRVVRGALSGLDENEVQVQGEQLHTLAFDDVISVEFEGRQARRIADGPLLQLANGDRLCVRPLQMNVERVVAAWSYFPEWAEVRIPLERLRSAVWDVPRTATQRRRLLRALDAHTADADELILKNGDRITGEFLGLATQTLSVETAVGEVSIPAENVRALAFNPVLISFPESTGRRALVSLSDGSRLTVRQLSLGEDGKLKFAALFDSNAGEPQQVDQAMRQVPLASVVSIRVLGGRAVYLSDIQPARFRFQPYLSGDWPWQADRSVVGSPLALRGTELAKGIGVHSQSHLHYDLDGRFDRFQATVGIDDAADGRGSVVFAVGLDGKRVAETDLLTGTSRPERIELDVSKATTLTLTVEFGEYGDICDYAVWGHALIASVD